MTSRWKAIHSGRRRRARGAAAVLAAALVCCGCRASSEPAGVAFNGAWDIISADAARIAWLKIEGAENGRPSGRFVMGTAQGGGGWYKDLGVSIHRGELRFQVRRDRERPPRPNEFYSARLVNGRLEGSCRFDRGGTPESKWTGERAPLIVEHDDGSWREIEPVELFDGKSLAGWRPMFPDREMGWGVRGGVLRNTTRYANNLVSEQKFWNFVLRAEYRLAERCDSGIGLRGRYEISIMDDAGKPVSNISHGAIFSSIAPVRNASRAAGEWQTMDARLVGREATVVLNGEKIVDRREIEGLTGLASDANESAPGPITIQGDHGLIEFRRMSVVPLVK